MPETTITPTKRPPGRTPTLQDAVGIDVYLSSADHARLLRLCDAQQLPLSTFVRNILLKVLPQLEGKLLIED